MGWLWYFFCCKPMRWQGALRFDPWAILVVSGGLGMYFIDHITRAGTYRHQTTPIQHYFMSLPSSTQLLPRPRQQGASGRQTRNFSKFVDCTRDVSVLVEHFRWFKDGGRGIIVLNKTFVSNNKKAPRSWRQLKVVWKHRKFDAFQAKPLISMKIKHFPLSEAHFEDLIWGS